MDLHDSVAVVTGSNRGLGREFAAQLLERGAKRVYATARNPERIQIAGVTPLGLDTDMAAHIDAPKANPADVAALALDSIETGLTEILADEITRGVKQGLLAPPAPRPAVVA